MLLKVIAGLLMVAALLFNWRLYYYGNEFTDTTGGWISQAWSGNSTIWTAVAPTLTKEASALKVDMSATYASGQSGVVRITNVVDLTDVSTVRVKFSGSLGKIYNPGSGRYQRLYLFVSDVTSGNWTSGTVYDALTFMLEHTASATYTFSDAVYSVDVSALTGSFRVCFGYVWAYQSEASWVRISEVELLS